MKDMLFIDDFMAIVVSEWGYYISLMQQGCLHGLYKVAWGRWNKLLHPLWDHLQYWKICRETGHAKLFLNAYSYGVQYSMDWKLINAMFLYFGKYFETPCIKWMIVSKVSD